MSAILNKFRISCPFFASTIIYGIAESMMIRQEEALFDTLDNAVVRAMNTSTSQLTSE